MASPAPTGERAVDAGGLGAVPVVCRHSLKAIGQLDEVFEVGFSGRQLSGLDEMIDEINQLEKRTEKEQCDLQAALFKLEDTPPPVEMVFYYRIIDLIGAVADYAEQTGNRLQIRVSV